MCPRASARAEKNFLAFVADDWVSSFGEDHTDLKVKFVTFIKILPFMVFPCKTQPRLSTKFRFLLEFTDTSFLLIARYEPILKYLSLNIQEYFQIPSGVLFLLHTLDQFLLKQLSTCTMAIFMYLYVSLCIFTYRLKRIFFDAVGFLKYTCLLHILVELTHINHFPVKFLCFMACHGR